MKTRRPSSRAALYDSCKPWVDEPRIDLSYSARKRQKKSSDAELAANRIRCARYRAKRRASELEIFRENAALKRERAELVDTVVKLEYTLNVLQGQASLDLSAENALLRREIQAQRGYIEGVLKAIHSQPFERWDSRVAAVAGNARRAVLSNVVGLFLGSIKDKAEMLGWSAAKHQGLKTIAKVCEEDVVPRVQVLPLGAPAHAAKRINIVTTFSHVHVPLDVLSEALWRWVSGSEIEDKFRKMTYLSELKINSVDVAEIAANEEAQLLTIRNNLASGKHWELLAMRKELDIAESHPNDKSKVRILSLSKPTRPTDDSACELDLSEDSLKSFVLQDVGGGKCSLTFVTSAPRMGWLQTLGQSNEPFVDECLQPSPLYVELLHAVSMLLEECVHESRCPVEPQPVV